MDILSQNRTKKSRLGHFKWKWLKLTKPFFIYFLAGEFMVHQCRRVMCHAGNAKGIKETLLRRPTALKVEHLFRRRQDKYIMTCDASTRSRIDKANHFWTRDLKVAWAADERWPCPGFCLPPLMCTLDDHRETQCSVVLRATRWTKISNLHMAASFGLRWKWVKKPKNE